MRIGVLCDTHALSFSELPLAMRDALAGMDLIVHAGDIVGKNVLDGLNKLKEVRAVQGNMDSQELRRLLPEKEIMSIGNRRIGIVHGSGGPQGIEERVRTLFDDVDIIIYGHSHVPQNRVIDGILFFNPGRCDRSFGVLTVGEETTGEIIKL